MTEDKVFQELKDLIVRAAALQVADIELLSKHSPAAGGRAKNQFIKILAHRLHKAGYRPKG